MVEQKKRGPKKGMTVKKGKTTMNSVRKVFQKEYDKLNKTKKEIEKQMTVLEKSGKDLGFKLSKRSVKTKYDTQDKPKGKRGRKPKKEVVTPEVKTV